jgi:type VI secretion system protein ImpG
MDPRLLKYYNTELRHIHEMGGEFAKQYPKIAARLGLDGFECADPYVERLLEGFAFLAARVQLKLDAEFPQFTQHLLEMVYPHYLAPTPSMAVVQFQPDSTEGSLAEGFVIPRGSVLRSALRKGEQTPCEFRTAHDVTLWPLELVEAEYVATSSTLPSVETPYVPTPRAGLRLRLRTTAGLTFEALSLESLPLYLRGTHELPMKIYEQLMAHSVAMVVRPAAGAPSWQEVSDRSCIRPMGFSDGEGLLPYGPRSFSGHRLLHEYFAFPNRYMFVELVGLAQGVRRCQENELDVFILFDRSEPDLEHEVNTSLFALHCAPAVNLFPKRADRIHLNTREHEYHVVPDRTRPMDFEVYEIRSVVGHGTAAAPEQEFLPFYSAFDPGFHAAPQVYHTVHRERRLLSTRQRRYGPRSSYVGSEVFVALVDTKEAPFRTSLRQLAVDTLCTNRDLPLYMPVGAGETDFTMDLSAPVDTVRCVAGPSKPRPSYVDGDTAWRLISHLSLNYLTLIDSDERRGAVALRELLALYGFVTEAQVRKQIEGVASVTSEAVYRRMPTPGPIAFGRGLEVTVTMDESAFEGAGCFLLGAILERFFARHVSINSFTEAVIRTLNRGEIMRWPLRAGQRHTL